MMKFEQERIKTGQKLFGEWFSVTSSQKMDVSGQKTITGTDEVAVSPVRPQRVVINQKAGARQVQLHLLFMGKKLLHFHWLRAVPPIVFVRVVRQSIQPS